MLHPFVSTEQTVAREAGGIATSLVVHASLVFALVTASGETYNVREVDGAVEERIARYTLVPPPETRKAPAYARGAHEPAPPGSEQPSALARLEKLTSTLRSITSPIDLAALLPAVDVGADYGAVATAGLDLEGGLARMIGRVYAGAKAGGVYDANVVERTVWPRRGNPIPRYPDQLMRDRIEASYSITFVVDSTGRVDGRSIAFPSEAHRLFVTAIRRALDRSRYYPAEIGGQRVAQLVQQQFKFEIAR